MRAALRPASFLLFFAIAVGPELSLGQSMALDQNYYAPLNPGLVKSAEYNHLLQAVNKMRQEMRQGYYSYQGAYGDLRYILDYFHHRPRSQSEPARLGRALLRQGAHALSELRGNARPIRSVSS
jgi:hypothetical protein